MKVSSPVWVASTFEDFDAIALPSWRREEPSERAHTSILIPSQMHAPHPRSSPIDDELHLHVACALIARRDTVNTSRRCQIKGSQGTRLEAQMRDLFKDRVCPASC